MGAGSTNLTAQLTDCEYYQLPLLTLSASGPVHGEVFGESAGLFFCTKLTDNVSLLQLKTLNFNAPLFAILQLSQERTAGRNLLIV